MIPSPQYFVHFFDYVKWADLAQLETTRGLSDEEYFKDRGWSFGSIHKVQLHNLGAQSIWLDRFVGNKPIWLPDEPRMTGRATIEPEWLAVHERFSKFLASQTPQSIAAELKYSNIRGEQFAMPLWHLVNHVCNHSMQHRGQLNSMVKLAGGKPATVDYSYWVNRVLKK